LECGRWQAWRGIGLEHLRNQRPLFDSIDLDRCSVEFDAVRVDGHFAHCSGDLFNVIELIVRSCSFSKSILLKSQVWPGLRDPVLGGLFL
jgi:hypothetical protein